MLDHATTDDDWDLYNRDSQLLNSIKTAADETLNNHNNQNNNLKPKSEINAEKDLNSSAQTNNTVLNQQSANGGCNGKQSVANLEVAIMQKLLIHEKKNASTLGEANNNTNDQITDNSTKSLALNKKRDFESTVDLSKSRKLADSNQIGQNNFINGNVYIGGDQIVDQNFKKRKLNNGEIISESKQMTNGFHKTSNHSPNNMNLYHSKSYSDGSDRDEPEDDESNSYFNDDEEEPQVPRITVKNRSYRLDKLNPYLINQMNETEKEFYINVCRQLYTEIYEI